MLLVLMALVVSSLRDSGLPVLRDLHLPFTWLETFFHEISHGITALLTGGRIERIVLEASGGGRCEYTNGWQPLVLFAGYFGAALWGTLIYRGATSSTHTAHRVALGLVIFIGVSGLLWASGDFTTWVILLVILLMIFVPLWFVQTHFVQWFLQFLGIYVLISSTRSLVDLLHSSSRQADAARLADLTGYGERFWVILWMFLSIGLLLLLWRKARLNSR